MKKLLIFLMFLFFISSVFAACTVTLDKESYVAGETATAAMSCSTSPEKNKDYTLNWTNQSGSLFESDTGTTPSVTGQLFYQSYDIPTNWPNFIFLNASLYGSSITVTQNDSANVSSTGGSNSLLITNTTFGGGFIGKVSSIKATVKDEGGKKISGGFCKISGWSNDETTMLMYQDTKMVDGEVKAADIFPISRFSEATDYAYKILCYCGSDTGGTECIDEDGASVNDSIGSAKGFFTTSTWLTVNTVTNSPPGGESYYEYGDLLTVCANVTNPVNRSRQEVEIHYNYRCGSGADTDIDRVVLGDYEEIRGISTNTTQMQCHDFTIHEEQIIEAGATECYGATDVKVLRKDGERILTYSTTSSSFTINSTKVHMTPDWKQISRLVYEAKVNLSDNDVGFKDIEVLLNNFLTHGGTPLIEIKNYTIQYWNGTASPYTSKLEAETEQFNGKIEYGVIKIEDVNTSLDEVFNVTLTLMDIANRSASALEGINTKTGTFHLDVNCPPFANREENMECAVSAQIEDQQLSQKEVDFTCYIVDEDKQYSSINFNQMITRTTTTQNLNFYIHPDLVHGSQYVLQCHADYYNFGSRRDSFYDTFTVYNAGGSSIRVGDGILGRITGKITGDGKGIGDIFDEFPMVKNMFWVFVIFLMALISFKILNIRGEIRFGEEHCVRRSSEDKKTSKLGQKLNRIMLKNEVKREKSKKAYNVTKVSKKEYHKLIKNNQNK